MKLYHVFLTSLHAALSLGAVISTAHESNHLESRKVAAELMLFPIPNCSSNGRIESITSDRCVSMRSLRAKGLVLKDITSGCRGKWLSRSFYFLSGRVTDNMSYTVLAFENENCSRPLTRLTVVNRCYDLRNYTALVADC